MATRKFLRKEIERIIKAHSNLYNFLKLKGIYKEYSYEVWKYVMLRYETLGGSLRFYLDQQYKSIEENNTEDCIADSFPFETTRKGLKFWTIVCEWAKKYERKQNPLNTD